MTPSLSEIKAAIRRLRASLDQIEAYLVPPLDGTIILGSPVLLRGHVEDLLPNEYQVRIEADRITTCALVDRINVMKA